MTYRTTGQMIEEIVRLRKEQGASQADLADHLGIDQSAVSKLESGERGLAATELASIADFFGVSAQALLTEESEALVFRAECDHEDVREAVDRADALIDGFLYFRALAA